MDKDKLKDDLIEDEEEGEEEDQEEEMSQEQLDDNLLKSCKDNNNEDAAMWLSKHASPTVEKEGWNPLLWASSHGNEVLLRLLIKHNACAPYLN
jgi:hypothetical protein